MRRVSLMFEYRATEREFLASRRDDLTRGMTLYAAIGFSILTLDLFITRTGEFRSTGRADALEEHRLWLTVGAFTIFLAAIIFFRAVRHSACISTRMREAVATFYIIVPLLLVPLFSRYYWAKLFGDDPHEIYPDLHFDDTTVLLLIDGIITAGHLMVPIRWCSLAPSEVSAVLVYAMCAVAGRPGDTGTHNLATLASLVLMAAIGKRALEYHERQAFLKVIEERNLRVQTEFQLSRLSGALPSVREAGPAAAPRNEPARDTLSNAASHQAAQAASSTSEISFNLSDTVSSSGTAQDRLARRAREVGVQTEGFPAEHNEVSTETPVQWADGDFRCRQCAKPPRPSPPPPPELLKEQFCRACRARLRNRRADASDSSASSTESSACSGIPTNPNFALTPMRTKQTMLSLIMLQCNIVVPPRTCCRFHAAAQDLLTNIKIMKGMQCRADDWGTPDSQCAQCLLVTEIDEDTNLCDVCMSLAEHSEGPGTDDAIPV